MPPLKKKKEEGESKFKCNYSGHGKPPRQVFDDKYLQLLKQNGWGGGGKKFPNTWSDREKTYNELMSIMGQKVQSQILTGRTGGAAGSQVEEVFVEDEGVDKEILDDGGGPHKKEEDNGSGQEEEEEEEQQDPLQEDHVDVTKE
jgi:hypothetical protein